MTESLFLAAAGGAGGAMALALGLLRVRRARRSLIEGLAMWTRVATPAAFSALLSLSAGALACLSYAIDERDPAQRLAQQYPNIEHPASTFTLLAQAPGTQAPSTESGEETNAASVSESEAADRKESALASLRDFASRIEDKRTMIASLGSDSAQVVTSALPDVDTMMGRLRSRLEKNPEDLKGWMTLGWAYANTGQFAEAVNAYEAALKLDGSNAEIKSALDDVKSKTAATSKRAE